MMSQRHPKMAQPGTALSVSARRPPAAGRGRGPRSAEQAHDRRAPVARRHRRTHIITDDSTSAGAKRRTGSPASAVSGSTPAPSRAGDAERRRPQRDAHADQPLAPRAHRPRRAHVPRRAARPARGGGGVPPARVRRAPAGGGRLRERRAPERRVAPAGRARARRGGAGHHAGGDRGAPAGGLHRAGCRRRGTRPARRREARAAASRVRRRPTAADAPAAPARAGRRRAARPSWARGPR